MKMIDCVNCFFDSYICVRQGRSGKQAKPPRMGLPQPCSSLTRRESSLPIVIVAKVNARRRDGQQTLAKSVTGQPMVS